MGLMDAIATLGLAGQGYAETDKAIAERDYLEKKRAQEEEVNRMAIEEARRKEARAAGLRNAVMEVANRPAMMGLDVATMAPNDPYQEHAVITKGEAVPESANVQAQAKAAQDYLSRQGDIEGQEKYRNILKSIEAEGYKTIAVGVAAGRSPKEIAAEFNTIGKERILGGAVDPGTGEYIFKMEGGEERRYNPREVRGLAAQMGWLKKPDLHNVPAGNVVLADGRPVFASPHKPSTEDPDLVAARTDFYRAGAEARRSRADLDDRRDPNLRGRGSRPVSGSPGTPAYNNEVSKLAGDHATGDDPISGKKKVDYERKNAIKSLAQRLATEDPEGYASAAAAVDAAVEQLDKVRADAERQANRELAENPGAPKAYNESANAYVARRVKELSKEWLKAPKAPKAKKPTPAERAADMPPIPSAVKAPDGKWYVKKPNGKWALVEAE